MSTLEQNYLIATIFITACLVFITLGHKLRKKNPHPLDKEFYKPQSVDHSILSRMMGIKDFEIEDLGNTRLREYHNKAYFGYPTPYTFDELEEEMRKRKL